MSGFRNLDRYKGAVKAVAKKNTETELATETVPERTARSSIIFEESPLQTSDSSTTTTSTQQPVAEPKEENPFNQVDSERNIVFLDKAELKTLGDLEAAGSNELKGASLAKLIERATSDKYADLNFQTDFLLTYRSFTTPRELLSLLIKRYNTPTPKDLSYGELQEWKQNVLRPIRLRVINILRAWVDKYWKDFTEDTEMSTKLHEFLVEDVQQSGFQSHAEQLTKLWDKKRTDPETERETVFSESPPKPLLPSLKNSSKSQSTQLGVMDLHSEEIARQLTLLEYNLYKAIKPWEFFNQGWTKKNKDVNSPHILTMINRFNEVSKWVTTEIVKADSLKLRTQVLVKFLEIADKCKQYNNFNAMMEILSGLQSSSVFRLKQTWNALTSRQKEQFEEIKDLMSRNQNYAHLRKHIRQCNPPLIPYLGLYLTDLTFIEDGNPDLIEGGLINWVKRRRLATVIKDIQQYQLKPFNLEEVPFIQEYLVSYMPLSEDEAYKMSLYRETRAPEKEEPPAKEKKSLTSIFKKKDAPVSPQAQKSPRASTVIKPSEEEPEEDDDFEIQYKEGYKFYDKDSEHNIILEKDPKGLNNDVIIAGTLPKLVERLTYEKYPDVGFLNSFLLTFRTFMTPSELIDLLTMRYLIPPPVNNTPEVMEQFKMKKETPIQLRVLNVYKTWIDKHVDDFKEDKQLLAKILEFIDQHMISSTSMSRAGQNLKAQITNKIEAKEEKKAYQFDKSPPSPILPSVEKPTLLDYSPEELARQLTLLDYEALTSIKPLEYLYLQKPSSWQMATEYDFEEETGNLKSSPHVVQVIYRFTDIRDWTATQIAKADNVEERARIIEFFIQIADRLTSLNNFHTSVAIIAALNSDLVLKLKSTWKLVSKLRRDQFVKLRDLFSYRSNFKALRDKLASIDFPAIPYIGMFIQDLAIIKEQMPDTIEPGSFINFAKRQKMAQLIYTLSTYCQQPYNLSPETSVQEFVKTLQIFENSEIQRFIEDHIEKDGDTNNTEDIFGQRSNSLTNSGSPRSSTSNGSPRPSMSASYGNLLSSTEGTGSPGGTRRISGSLMTSSGELSDSQEKTNVSKYASPRLSRMFTSAKELDIEPTPTVSVVEDKPEPKPEPVKIEPVKAEPVKTEPEPVKTEPVKTETPVDNSPVGQFLAKTYPGSTTTTWSTVDTEGEVYGWKGENISCKVVSHNSEILLLPIVNGFDVNYTINKPELSLLVRIKKMYATQTSQSPKLVAFAHSVSESVHAIASKEAIQIRLMPN